LSVATTTQIRDAPPCRRRNQYPREEAFGVLAADAACAPEPIRPRRNAHPHPHMVSRPSPATPTWWVTFRCSAPRGPFSFLDTGAPDLMSIGSWWQMPRNRALSAPIDYSDAWQSERPASKLSSTLLGSPSRLDQRGGAVPGPSAAVKRAGSCHRISFGSSPPVLRSWCLSRPTITNVVTRDASGRWRGERGARPTRVGAPTAASSRTTIGLTSPPEGRGGRRGRLPALMVRQFA
jgi:hypothetical protein